VYPRVAFCGAVDMPILYLARVSAPLRAEKRVPFAHLQRLVSYFFSGDGICGLFLVLRPLAVLKATEPPSDVHSGCETHESRRVAPLAAK
jgi:hypothetical protein